MRFVACGLWIAVTACGDNGAGRSIAIADLGVAFRDAWCAFEARCGLYPDHATCIALSEPWHFHPGVPDAIAAGTIAYDAFLATMCVDALATGSCDRTSRDVRYWPTACRRFTRGLVGDGGDCYFDDECAAGYCVGIGSEDCTQGWCSGGERAVDGVAVGEPCTSSDTCVEGAYCAPADRGGYTCAVLRAPGQPCTTALECGYGTGCVTVAGEQVCAALPALGEPCPDLVCRDVGAYCSATTGRCESLGLAGASCEDSQRCSYAYPCGYATRTCTPPPGPGERCVDGGCAGELRCDATATCVAPALDGEACATDYDCASDQCVARVCVQATACRS